jgi:hypothetical protein
MPSTTPSFLPPPPAPFASARFAHLPPPPVTAGAWPAAPAGSPRSGGGSGAGAVVTLVVALGLGVVALPVLGFVALVAAGGFGCGCA